MGPHDLRFSDRYTAEAPIPGSFGLWGVSVLDLSDQGARIEHAQPLRLATRGRLSFRAGVVAAAAGAIVVWSRISKTTPNDKGKHVYQSGLRIEENIERFNGALRQLIDLNIAGRDLDSLDRKLRQMEERDAELKSKPVTRAVQQEIPTDEELLIRHVRERLKMNPDEASKWYQRARSAVVGNGATSAVVYKEEALAVWEYLERSVPLLHVVRVFEKKN